MKKLLSLFTFLSVATMAHCQNSAISLTPLTRVEFIERKATFTTPIDLKLTHLYQIGISKFYYGIGVGFGLNTNIGSSSDIHGEVPVMGIFGGELMSNLPAFSIGVGLNALNGNPILGFGLNLYTFPLKKSEMLVPAIINNDDYKRNKIGY